MTTQQIAELGPAFARYLKQFLFCCSYTQTFDLLSVYCRGLLSDLKRKTCEPIALYSGVAVRTLQEFLHDHLWSHQQVRDCLQRHVAAVLPGQDNDLGTIGLIDETSVKKKGVKTPGVQRQYCGEAGKTENCIVTVHLGVARGRYKTLIDADLFLPKAWDADRARCQRAGIPKEVVYRPKWRIALEQIDRARGQGVAFDWLTFDADYGDKPGFLVGLDERGLRFAGETSKSQWCFARPPSTGASASRADDLVRHSPVFTGQPWQRVRLPRQTVGDQQWDAKAAPVWLSQHGMPTTRTYWLIVTRNVRTGEEKYFVANASQHASVQRCLKHWLRVAFTRWNVEHALRLCKGEIGFRCFEGRNYRALLRHLLLCCVTLTFVAGETSRLRKKKSGDDGGAGVRGFERGMRELAGASATNDPETVQVGSHRLSPAA